MLTFSQILSVLHVPPFLRSEGTSSKTEILKILYVPKREIFFVGSPAKGAVCQGRLELPDWCPSIMLPTKGTKGINNIEVFLDSLYSYSIWYLK